MYLHHRFTYLLCCVNGLVCSIYVTDMVRSVVNGDVTVEHGSSPLSQQMCT